MPKTETFLRHERRINDAIKLLQATLRSPNPGSVLDFDLAETARVITEARVAIAADR